MLFMTRSAEVSSTKVSAFVSSSMLTSRRIRYFFPLSTQPPLHLLPIIHSSHSLHLLPLPRANFFTFNTGSQSSVIGSQSSTFGLDLLHESLFPCVHSGQLRTRNKIVKNGHTLGPPRQLLPEWRRHIKERRETKTRGASLPLVPSLPPLVPSLPPLTLNFLKNYQHIDFLFRSCHVVEKYFQYSYYIMMFIY